MTGIFIFAKEKIGRPGENAGTPDFFVAAESSESVAISVAVMVAISVEIAVLSVALRGFVAAAVPGLAEFVALVFGLAAVEAVALDGSIEFPFGAGNFFAALIGAVGGGAGGSSEQEKAGEQGGGGQRSCEERGLDGAECFHWILPRFLPGLGAGERLLGRTQCAKGSCGFFWK